MPIGHAFIELGSVDSTNNYAMARVHAGSASHGTIFFARDQWAGKGQRGKTWTSKPGENIVMTVVLQPSVLPVASQFHLSAAIALASHDLFGRYAGLNDLAIKWPNDLYWRDRKAGGILIENSFRGGDWLFAVAGIGININQTLFPETLRNPVSLKQITGRSFESVSLARELAGDLERWVEPLRSHWTVGGGKEVMDEYNARLYRRGQQTLLKQGDTTCDMTIRRVTETGELVAWDDRKEGEKIFRFGEVEWL